MSNKQTTSKPSDFPGDGRIRLRNPQAPIQRKGILPTPHEYRLLQQALEDAAAQARRATEPAIRAALLEQLDRLHAAVREVYSVYSDRYASKSQQLRAALLRLKRGESCWVDDNTGVSPIAAELKMRVITRKLREGGYEVTRLK